MYLFFLILVFLFFLGSPVTPQLKPNIILILADDLGYKDVSPYNPDITYTPHIQALADNGITLSQFYVPVAQCTPTRAALLTGKYPIRFEADGLATALTPVSIGGLNEGSKALAGQLRKLNYRTGLVGKWHLGQPGPLANGFNYAWWLPFGNATNVLQVWENGTLVKDFPNFRLINQQMIKQAIQFMDSAPEPFFLYLPHVWPHVPLLVDQREGLDYYQSTVSEIDDLLGEIVNHLEDTGRLDDTIIVFASDNGPHQSPFLDGQGRPIVTSGNFRNLAEAGIYPDATNPARWVGGLQDFRPAEYERINNYSALRLRTGKASVYEGGLRVPLIISWPGHYASGTTIDEPVIIMDLYNTLIEFAGGIAPGSDGESLVKLLEGGQREGYTFHFYLPGGTYGAIRQGQWKLHFNENFQPGALYRLNRDEQEMTDLGWLYPDLVVELTQQARTFDVEARRRSVYLPLIAY